MMKISWTIIAPVILLAGSCSRSGNPFVSDREMQAVFEEVSTPFKYGLVLAPGSDSLKYDSPAVFRKNGSWHMTYIVFDGRGYETWLTSSDDLLRWGPSCRIISFPGDTALWDSSQRAGYPALLDPVWGGSYEPGQFGNRYWMSYLGGKSSGYEAGRLAIGIASTEADPSSCHDWELSDKPVLTSEDGDARWWENKKIYKSTIIRDSLNLTGYDFVMYYNAFGDSLTAGHGAERIGMAVSDDMVTWKRFMNDPVLNHFRGITGDPQLTRIGDLWVMFYFGAFRKSDGSDGAFDRFACSRDLIRWTDWKGNNLIEPSESYDGRYAHKPFIVRWNGTVYHFYCAVNDRDQRGIALATSKDLGKSNLSFTSHAR